MGCCVRWVNQVLENSLAGVDWLQVVSPCNLVTETLVAVQVDTLGKKVLVGIAFGYLGLILFLPTLNIFYQVRATSTPSLRALRCEVGQHVLPILAVSVYLSLHAGVQERVGALPLSPDRP